MKDIREDLPKLEEVSLRLIRWMITLENGEEFGFAIFKPEAFIFMAEHKEQAALNVGVSPKIISFMLDQATQGKDLKKIKKGALGFLLECLYELKFSLRIESFANQSISQATGILMEELELLDQWRKDIEFEYFFTHSTMSAQYARSYTAKRK